MDPLECFDNNEKVDVRGSVIMTSQKRYIWHLPINSHTVVLHHQECVSDLSFPRSTYTEEKLWMKKLVFLWYNGSVVDKMSLSGFFHSQ